MDQSPEIVKSPLWLRAVAWIILIVVGALIAALALWLLFILIVMATGLSD